jgi:hypothetical protein
MGGGAALYAMALYMGLYTGISAGWPFTLGGSFEPFVSTSITINQAVGGPEGNQTISENMDNTTVSSFSGGSRTNGTVNSDNGLSLGAPGSMASKLGALLVWDATKEIWQVIYGTHLSS